MRLHSCERSVQIRHVQRREADRAPENRWGAAADGRGAASWDGENVPELAEAVIALHGS